MIPIRVYVMNLLNRHLLPLLFIIFILPVSIVASEERYDIPVGDSPTWGPENAPITIIEFIDYQ